MKRIAEMKKLTLPELEEKARTLRRSLFILRTQHGQGQLAKPGQMRQARRDLARALTMAGEKRREGAGK